MIGQSFFQDQTLGPVLFIDTKAMHYSELSQPRDIEIVSYVPSDHQRRIKQAICVEIRLSQGCNEIGVAKNLKWN